MTVDLEICIECGERAQLASGRKIYPHRADLWEKRYWLCQCGAYVGCHGPTPIPLGRPAGPETRAARQAAHAAFDPLWRSGQMPRYSAYKWLGAQMGKAASKTHIGWMTADEARDVVRICVSRGIEMGAAPYAAKW